MQEKHLQGPFSDFRKSVTERGTLRESSQQFLHGSSTKGQKRGKKREGGREEKKKRRGRKKEERGGREQGKETLRGLPRAAQRPPKGELPAGDSPRRGQNTKLELPPFYFLGAAET